MKPCLSGERGGQSGKPNRHGLGAGAQAEGAEPRPWLFGLQRRWGQRPQIVETVLKIGKLFFAHGAPSIAGAIAALTARKFILDKNQAHVIAKFGFQSAGGDNRAVIADPAGDFQTIGLCEIRDPDGVFRT